MRTSTCTDAALKPSTSTAQPSVQLRAEARRIAKCVALNVDASASTVRFATTSVAAVAITGGGAGGGGADGDGGGADGDGGSVGGPSGTDGGGFGGGGVGGGGGGGGRGAAASAAADRRWPASGDDGGPRSHTHVSWLPFFSLMYPDGEPPGGPGSLATIHTKPCALMSSG